MGFLGVQLQLFRSGPKSRAHFSPARFPRVLGEADWKVRTQREKKKNRVSAGFLGVATNSLLGTFAGREYFFGRTLGTVLEVAHIHWESVRTSSFCNCCNHGIYCLTSHLQLGGRHAMGLHGQVRHHCF